MPPGPDPYVLPENPPDVAGWHYCRFNNDWLAIVLGGLLDSLYQDGVWLSGTEPLFFVPQEVDQLLYQIAKPLLTIPQPQFSQHIWALSPNKGTWSRIYSASPYDGAAIYNTTNTADDKLVCTVGLLAGDWAIQVGHWKGPTGANLHIFLVDDEANEVDILNSDTYQASGAYNYTSSATFTLDEDYAGLMYIEADNNGSHGGSANTLTLQALAMWQV